jgi:general L-amino acid transport system substrate-binding protein
MILAWLMHLVLGAVLASPAQADSIVGRIKTRGVVRCGSVERPGLAWGLGSERWVGLEVDICRAIAVAVLGAPDRIEYHGYVSPSDFARIRRQDDDVFFLSGAEVFAHKLAGSIVPGPTVFLAGNAVMVPADAPEQHVIDLADKGICYLIGSSAENGLNDYFEERHKDWFHHAYSEEGEMNDAYGVQRCHAIAGETTQLGLARLYRATAKFDSRMLPEPLSVFPIFAATGIEDARWSAIVAWTVNTLVSSERVATPWREGGADAMPVSAPELGLTDDWQVKVLRLIGHYGAIYERDLGARSPLKLNRGPNAAQFEGGTLPAPLAD